MPGRETVEIAVGPDEKEVNGNVRILLYFMKYIQNTEDCESCNKRNNVFSRNVGVGACSVTDKVRYFLVF